MIRICFKIITTASLALLALPTFSMDSEGATKNNSGPSWVSFWPSIPSRTSDTKKPVDRMGQAPMYMPLVVGFSAGPAWANGAGMTQSFYSSPQTSRTYLANQRSTVSSALADFEVFLGIHRPLSERVQAQFGLAIAATTDVSATGEIWDDEEPPHNNFIYSYKVQHAHLAAKGKLVIDIKRPVKPYLSGSIGVGFNRASGYNNVPLIFEAGHIDNFTNNTVTALTYTLGLGLQYELSRNWQVGGGYEFADWGSNELGKAADQTMNSGLSMNHLYTNNFMLNITYLM